MMSARKLNQEIREVLAEKQIYRIDHYLGKETVQNILVFRFSNGIFEPIWNRRYIDHIQITVAETVGVEQRGRLLRPFRNAARHGSQSHFPAHLPDRHGASGLLRCRRGPGRTGQDPESDSAHDAGGCAGPHRPRPVWRSRVNGAEKMPAYRSEPMVPRAIPNTETFVAMKLFVDNWRWADIPFYLRTGKRLAQARH